MKNFLRFLISFRPVPSLAEAELDYLNSCVSLADLERRQREIDRGLFRQPVYAL